MIRVGFVYDLVAVVVDKCGFGRGKEELVELFAIAFEMEGAFNDVVMKLQPGASEAAVLADAAEATGGRTRPLCEYPSFARLKDGATDLNDAASFVCSDS